MFHCNKSRPISLQKNIHSDLLTQLSAASKICLFSASGRLTVRWETYNQSTYNTVTFTPKHSQSFLNDCLWFTYSSL